MFRNKVTKLAATMGLAAAMFAPLLPTSASAEGYYSEKLNREQVVSSGTVRQHSHEDHYRPRPVEPAYPGMQGMMLTPLEQSGATGGNGQGQ